MKCGIDEAGRGAVLGPLVISGAIFDNPTVKKLKKLGVKDSKLLTPKHREDLFPKLISLAQSYEIISIPAAEIDARFNHNLNLNTLEIKAFKAILKKLEPKEAFVDSVLRNPEKLKQQLAKASPAKLVVEHKADEKYVVVGAASILAKVTRDRAIRKLEKQCLIKLGSGYPSDPTTIAFLKQAKHYPKFVRRSWGAFKKVVAEKEQSQLSSFQ